MSPASQTEAWQRGPVAGYEPLVMPVVHALLQAREDLEALGAVVTPEQLWARPGAASIGFHVRHTGGAIDRLFTYARGEVLSETQKGALREEGAAGEPMQSLLESVSHIIERALEQLRSTTAASLLDERKLGRAGLPTTVLGLLFHAAEHATRHVGQAITTAKILRSLPPST